MEESVRRQSKSSFSSMTSTSSTESFSGLKASTVSLTRTERIQSKSDDIESWSQLVSKIYPLFNGEGLRGSIEEINHDLQ